MFLNDFIEKVLYIFFFLLIYFFEIGKMVVKKLSMLKRIDLSGSNRFIKDNWWSVYEEIWVFILFNRSWSFVYVVCEGEDVDRGI